MAREVRVTRPRRHPARPFAEPLADRLRDRRRLHARRPRRLLVAGLVVGALSPSSSAGCGSTRRCASARARAGPATVEAARARRRAQPRQSDLRSLAVPRARRRSASAASSARRSRSPRSASWCCPSFMGEAIETADVDLGPISNFPEGEYVISTFPENPAQGEVSRRTAFVRNNGRHRGRRSRASRSSSAAACTSGARCSPNGRSTSDAATTGTSAPAR